MNLPDELKKLADLRQSGALTEEEFVQAKARLIDSGSEAETKDHDGWLIIVFGVLMGIIVLTGSAGRGNVSELLGSLVFPTIIIVVGCYYAGFIKKAI